MAIQHFAEPSDRPREPRPVVADAGDRPVQVVGPYLTTGMACDYLLYTGKHRLRSLYRFIAANGVPMYRKSPRAILLRRADLDQVLRRGGKGRG